MNLFTAASADAEAADLLDSLLRRGFSVRAEGDRLYVEPRRLLAKEDLGAILAHKRRLLRLLAGPAEAAVRVTLRPLPGAVPAAVRLRKWLKLGLRAFGLKVESIEPVPKPPAGAPPPGGDG